MAKLTIEFEGRKVTIENENVFTGQDFSEELFRPALLALQFHEDTVNKVLGREE